MATITPEKDAAWFDAKWRTAAKSVTRVCAIRAPQGEAADCFALSMERAWRNREQYDGTRDFANWACKIAVRVCLDEARWINRRIRACDLDNPAPCGATYSEVISDGTDIHADLERQEFWTEFGEAVDALSAIQRDVVRLILDGDQYAQVAAQLDLSIGTVRSRVHRAQRVLRGTVAA